MRGVESRAEGNYLSMAGEKKGRGRWWNAGLWGAGSLIAFTALSNSLGVGILGGLLGGAYGYKRASSAS